MAPTTLSPEVTLAVLGAGVVHATWNAIASSIRDKVLTFGLIGVTEAVVAAALLPVVGLPAWAAWPFAAVSCAIHVAYNSALLQSYRLGDFGHAYPLARGTAPLLVAVGAWAWAGETLSGVQIAGVGAVAAGLLAIVLAAGRLRRADLPVTVAATLTGITIAGYTIVDGLGVRHAGNPTGYLALTFLLQGPIFAAISTGLLRGRLGPQMLADVPRGVVAGVLSMVAYGIVVWAQTRGPLALVSALRETGVISAAVIATLVFHEPFGRRRVGPAMVVVAGIMLIGT